MSDAILVAMITSAVTLFGVILSNSKTNNEIKHLTEEVKKHNNFAQRIPVVEVQIEDLEKRVLALERREK